MKKYHAVMLDELGEEFGADVEADNLDDAYAELADRYPESRVAELKSNERWDRERDEMMEFFANGGDFDDEGRPFYHY